MIFDFFQRKPLLEETTRQWLHAVFAWALRHQGEEIFFSATDLVLPTPEHFPGRATSVHEMAQLMFESVREHAGLRHWPCQLVERGALAPQPYPPQPVAPPVRQPHRPGAALTATGTPALFTYPPELVNNPEALIASFAQAFAHHLAATAPEAPPGGQENWGHVTELVGVFMGFGLMFVNTAFTVRVNACGACQGPAAEREGFLSQADLTYALALFCRLKKIPPAQARRHLKSTLRPFFRRALREIDRHPEDLARVSGAATTAADPAPFGGFTQPF